MRSPIVRSTEGDRGRGGGGGGGFHSTHQIEPLTHIMFVDDLKVYAEGKKELDDTIKVVEGVSRALGMGMGLKKCAVAHMVQGS